MSLETLVQNQTHVLVNRFGVSATLSRSVMGEYDTATGTVSAGSVLTAACSVIRDAASSSALGYVFGAGLVQTGDEKFVIPARDLTFDPMPGDTVTISGVAWRVVGVHPVYVGTTIGMFELLVRR